MNHNLFIQATIAMISHDEVFSEENYVFLIESPTCFLLHRLVDPDQAVKHPAKAFTTKVRSHGFRSWWWMRVTWMI